jgi:hypothetical protein
MKRVYTADSLADVGHVKNLLEQSGIPCLIRNEQLSGALGEVPFLECLPELWVLDDDDAAEALCRVAELGSADAGGPPWRCRHCGEENEAQFAACWRCGRPDG